MVVAENAVRFLTPLCSRLFVIVMMLLTVAVDCCPREYFERHKTALHYQCSQSLREQMNQRKSQELNAKHSYVFQKSVRALALTAAVASSGSSGPCPEPTEQTQQSPTNLRVSGEDGASERFAPNESVFSVNKPVMESERCR